MPPIKVLAAVVAVVVAIAGVAGYFLLSGPSEGGGSTTSATTTLWSTSTTSSTPISTETASSWVSTSVSTLTTHSSSPGSAGMTIWDWEQYRSITSIRVAPSISLTTGKLDYWPVYYGGKFYAVSAFEGEYNLTINNTRTIRLWIRYTLTPNQDFTAACVNPETGKVAYTERFSNTIRIGLEMKLGDGTWYRYAVYLYNASGLNYYSTLPGILDLQDWTTYKYGVLGGEVSSPSGHLRWSYVAGKDPTNVELVMNCKPFIEDSESINDVMKALHGSEDFKTLNEMRDAIPMFSYLPTDLFSNELINLAEIGTQKVLKDVSSGNPMFDTYDAVITNEGETTVPGGDVPAHTYRVEFATNPDVLTGHYVLANDTIIPLEYSLNFKNPGWTVTVTFHLKELKVLWEWPATPENG